MDFDLNEDQKMLAKTVADFGRKESGIERFRKLRDAEGPGFSKQTWAQMGELGWIAVAYPEEVGGFGGGMVEAGLILEQMGKTLIPEPFLSSAVLGGRALLRGGNADQHAKWLAPMLEGQSVIALAWAEAKSRFDAAAIETTATKDGEGFVLNGEKTFVLDGVVADQLVVSAKLDGEVALFVVDGEATERQALGLIDGHRAAKITLKDIKVGADAHLSAMAGIDALSRTLDDGAAATVAEGLGVAQAMLAMTSEYLKTREQFGVKIGSFQALQHRAVDMFVEVELLKSINIASLVGAGNDEQSERESAIAAAKHHLATGATFASRQAIQLHGGVGVTDEHDIGLFFKRMHSLTTICGDDAFHSARFEAHNC